MCSFANEAILASFICGNDHFETIESAMSQFYLYNDRYMVLCISDTQFLIDVSLLEANYTISGVKFHIQIHKGYRNESEMKDYKNHLETNMPCCFKLCDNLFRLSIFNFNIFISIDIFLLKTYNNIRGGKPPSGEFLPNSGKFYKSGDSLPDSGKL